MQVAPEGRSVRDRVFAEYRQGTFPQSSALNFQAGDVLANTTVIPWGGRTAGAPDFTVRYNGPSGQADVIVDIVGYFIENKATPLSCVDLISQGNNVVVQNGSLFSIIVPSCTTGYTRTGAGCYRLGDSPPLPLTEVTPMHADCEWFNNSGATVNQNGWATEAVCCRVPGQ